MVQSASRPLLAAGILIGAAVRVLSAGPGGPSAHEARGARISVHTARQGCAVTLDGKRAGSTNEGGNLVLEAIDPGDHYLHILCPEQQEETAYFVSPGPGATAEVRQGAPAAGPGPEGTGSRIKLQQLVQQAVQLRAKGKFREAVEALRDATRLDAENSDLHRELGITFLLDKDWKRARVEMIEALHHDPGDADAHNGLGYALEKLGELDQALKEYRTATQLEPDDAGYRQHYIDALAREAAGRLAKK